MSFFNIFLIFWVLVAVVTFIYLFFDNAPYGRHIKSGWGKNISARAGWVVMESPCVILMLIFAFIVYDQLLIVHKVFLCIWLSHYIHRSFIYPFVIDMTNPKMPISIAISAFCFNLINVSIQAFGIFYFTSYSDDWLLNSTFICGLTLFVIGMFINIRSDYLIVALRKENGAGYHLSLIHI